MEKSYNSVVISCPEIVDGGTYTVVMGETSTEVKMDGLIYGSGFGMGGGFGGGNFGGGGKMDGFGGGKMGDSDSDRSQDMGKHDKSNLSDQSDNGGNNEDFTGGGREVAVEGDSDNTKKE
jgi:hypothetical protein